MRKALLGPTLVGLLLSAFLMAGCGNDSIGPVTDVDLSGSYTLQALTQGGFTFGPPIATGTLALTRTTYSLDMTIAVPDQPAEQVQDAGTYTVSGSQWTQSSTTSGVQSVGSYTLQNDVLTVDVTTQGQAISTVWLKQ